MLFCSIYINGQDKVLDSIIMAFEDLRISKIHENIERVNDQAIKELIRLNYLYLKNGDKYDHNADYRSFSTKKREDIIHNLLLSDYLTHLKVVERDSLIYSNYRLSLATSKKLFDTLLIRESLKRLCQHIIYKTRDAELLSNYIVEFSKYSNNVKEDFWTNYLKMGYYFMLSEGGAQNIEVRKKMDAVMGNLLALSKSGGFRAGRVYQLHGVYLSHWKKNYALANIYNLKADSIFGNIPYWYSKSRRAGIKYNSAINYYKNKQPEKAIPFLKQDLKRDKEKIYLMYTNEWLYKCYESLKKYDSAFFYFKEMNKVKNEIDQQEHSLAIRGMDNKYDFEEKEKELQNLSKTNESLRMKLYSTFPFIVVALFITVVLYFLYVKNKKKNELLNKEKSETLLKLDELKSLVTKNHILLKDKTKIYISDFMYVKSNDHYLDIFISNGKKHFVRGTLSQLKEELPPNFIQCHRSYIVNSNFIKRSNKNTLFLINGEMIPYSQRDMVK